MVKDSDVKSDILLVLDLMIWLGLYVELLRVGAEYFLVYWLVAPVLGSPVYWVVTQLVVGYVITRSATKRNVKKGETRPASVKPTPPPTTAPQVISEEP